MRLTRRGRLVRTAAILTVVVGAVTTVVGGSGHAHRAPLAARTPDVVHLPVGLRAWTAAAERPVRRYRLVAGQDVAVNRQRYARIVDEALTDPRGWGRDYTFRHVTSRRVAFTIVLASRERTDRLCAPYQTNGLYSCYNNGRVVINHYRWSHGAQTYGWQRFRGLYRHYVVLHEVGHAIGYGHRYSCRDDGLAPTMMQQTKSLYGCRRNAWPYPSAASNASS